MECAIYNQPLHSMTSQSPDRSDMFPTWNKGWAWGEVQGTSLIWLMLCPVFPSLLIISIFSWQTAQSFHCLPCEGFVNVTAIWEVRRASQECFQTHSLLMAPGCFLHPAWGKFCPFSNVYVQLRTSWHTSESRQPAWNSTLQSHFPLSI